MKVSLDFEFQVETIPATNLKQAAPIKKYKLKTPFIYYNNTYILEYLFDNPYQIVTYNDLGNRVYEKGFIKTFEEALQMFITQSIEHANGYKQVVSNLTQIKKNYDRLQEAKKQFKELLNGIDIDSFI